MQIRKFTFNEFAENTYLLIASDKSCAIIDPGCNTNNERRQLDNFIDENKLKPVLLVNTHAHLDHVFGVDHVSDTYGLPLHLHANEEPLLRMTAEIARMYGLKADPVKAHIVPIDEGDILEIGTERVELLYTPGHSPASLCLYHRESKQLICGDVLFNGSIGRTDLPGGDHDTLINSIAKKLLPLDDDVKVYPGHGPETTIGFERRHNPFLQGITAK